MKRIFLFVLLCMFGVAFGDVRWLTSKEIEKGNLKHVGGYNTTAMCYCDTKFEAENVVGVYNLNKYRTEVTTIDEEVEYELWIIIFFEYTDYGPKTCVFHYLVDGIMETYLIF